LLEEVKNNPLKASLIGSKGLQGVCVREREREREREERERM
jgi:hypothetical protein